MASVVADIFRQAATLNLEDPRRAGNVVTLKEASEVIVGGDIHGYRHGLAKIIDYAAVARHADRRLVLQEILHGALDADGYDRSAEVLLRAARLKVAQPHEVLFVLGNHDIAQMTGNEILRDGRPCCRGFTEGVWHAFGAEAEEVLAGIETFLMSLPMAVRCPNGVFISHSLPSPGRMEQAGLEILDRPFTREDFQRGRPVYEWLWGRGHTPEHLDALAERLAAEFFVLGHQHTDEGCLLLGPRAIVVISAGPRGCLMELPARTALDRNEPGQYIRRLASLPVGPT
jgi:hypothetical protein